MAAISLREILKMEDAQMQIESEIRRCSVEELYKIALGIKVPEDQWRGKSRVAVMRAIAEVIDAD